MSIRSTCGGPLGALQVQYIKPEGYSMAKKQTPLTVETLKHDEATRTNIPTAEHQSVLNGREKTPIRLAYERRNRDLDPQLVWRGKDEQDWSDLVVYAIDRSFHKKGVVFQREKQ